jgi:hypothetical protein
VGRLYPRAALRESIVRPLATGRAGRALWPAPPTSGATDDVGQHKERDDDADDDRDDCNGGGGQQHGTILSRPRNPYAEETRPRRGRLLGGPLTTVARCYQGLRNDWRNAPRRPAPKHVVMLRRKKRGTVVCGSKRGVVRREQRHGFPTAHVATFALERYEYRGGPVLRFERSVIPPMHQKALLFVTFDRPLSLLPS